jgi:hypothetical protein
MLWNLDTKWMKTENVFDNYINYLYEFKKNAKKGSAQYTLAKLMMNGLYGKTIQRPILDENVIIRLHEEFIWFVVFGSVFGIFASFLLI